MKSGKKTDKVDVSGGESLGQNPFGALGSLALPDAPKAPGETVVTAGAKNEKSDAGRNRGRVDVLREKAGRGGKTVTVAAGFAGIGLPEKELLAKKMQKACGVGGTVKDGRIEIQGDKREEVARILSEAGFRPVFAGG